MYSVCKQSAYTARVDVRACHIYVHVYINSPNYLRRSIFAACSIAGYLHQYNQQIRNCERRQVNVKIQNVEYRDGTKIKKKTKSVCLVHIVQLYKTCNSQPRKINDTSPMLCTKRTTKLHNQFLCVEIRRDKSLGGIHKQFSVMLNIKLWRGLAHKICT